MKRRILDELKLTEISGVDRPCQQGATVSIMKRDYSSKQRDKYAEEDVAMKDGSYPIPDVAALHDAISAYGRSPTPATKSHIMARAKSLGASDQLPEKWMAKSVDDLSARIKKLQAKVDELNKFDPHQLRDDIGRWASSSVSGVKGAWNAIPRPVRRTLQTGASIAAPFVVAAAAGAALRTKVGGQVLTRVSGGVDRYMGSHYPTSWESNRAANRAAEAAAAAMPDASLRSQRAIDELKQTIATATARRGGYTGTPVKGSGFIMDQPPVGRYQRTMRSAVSATKPVVTESSTGTKGSVPFMITRDMKQRLLDLGYKMNDIKNMTATQAHANLLGKAWSPASREAAANARRTHSKAGSNPKAVVHGKGKKKGFSASPSEQIKKPKKGNHLKVKPVPLEHAPPAIGLAYLYAARRGLTNAVHSAKGKH